MIAGRKVVTDYQVFMDHHLVIDSPVVVKKQLDRWSCSLKVVDSQMVVYSLTVVDSQVVVSWPLTVLWSLITKWWSAVTFNGAWCEECSPCNAGRKKEKKAIFSPKHSEQAC